MWHLVWEDAFDVDGAPDPTKWIYERGFVRNEEWQWYQPQNAFCENGLLVIEGRREQFDNPNFDVESADWRSNRRRVEYTSASLTTRGLHHWLFGRFEMRARIDVREGLWPAFWTLGIHGEWPSNGEIDIMEYYRGYVLANAAWGTRERFTPRWSTSMTPLADFGGAQWARDFHVWRMDWNEEAIALYVDGQLLNRVDLSQTYNEDDDGHNPFHQPHYIVLNLAIGGTNGGDASSTSFPARFEVDYVRVYQR